MTSGLTIERVQATVARIAGLHGSPSDAGPDTRLTEGGFWLDSLRLLETIIACEEEFGVIFDPDTDFTNQTLKTVRTLFDLIRTKRLG